VSNKRKGAESRLGKRGKWDRFLPALLLTSAFAWIFHPGLPAAAFNPDAAAILRDRHGIDHILFIKRKTYQSSHYYTDYVDGCKFFGTDIRVLDLKTGETRSILPERLKTGIVGRMDLSFDAKRVVFDWKADDKSGFHIWEMNVDGGGCRQLTFPPADEAEIVAKYHNYKENPHHWVNFPDKYPVDFGVYGHWFDDMHPCYLPDGGIAFISTRCRHGILCDGGDILTSTVLYRMDANGGRFEKLSDSSVSEANPAVMEDGRILYTRWEYVDKGASCVKCLWAMGTDGTASVEIFGNDHAMPPSIIHGRQIPGEPNLFVATAAPHCPNTGVGGLILIDTTKNIRSAEAMTLLTPETTILAEGWYAHPKSELYEKAGELAQCMGPHFADPFPLDRGTFLMACQPHADKMWKEPCGYGIFLYEGPGRYAPVYQCADSSCWMPIPLRPRERPPVRTGPRDATVAEVKLAGRPAALCIVTDVYQGMTGVARGDVKFLRVNEQVPRPWAARRFWREPASGSFDQQHSPVGATHLGLKIQWGVVPVEEDGSAHFYVPADRNIFLQALDADFQEIQRERTYVNYRPGEVRSCIGCHETQHDAPPVKAAPLALSRAPSIPGPQPGEETGRRCLDFEADIQPILDRHCVECHDGNHAETDLDLTGRRTRFFNVAYENLIGRKCSADDSYEVKNRDLVGRLIMEIHPKVGNAEYLPPKTLGSTTSKLIRMLREGHEDIKLSREEMVALTTWVDSNCQYYGSYWGRKHLAEEGHPDFRPKVAFEVAISEEERVVEGTANGRE
jgi:hypothetical protein